MHACIMNGTRDMHRYIQPLRKRIHASGVHMYMHVHNSLVHGRCERDKNGHVSVCPPRDCNKCPDGAFCEGKDSFVSSSPNTSTWEIEKLGTLGSNGNTKYRVVKRIISCPPGELRVYLHTCACVCIRVCDMVKTVIFCPSGEFCVYVHTCVCACEYAIWLRESYPALRVSCVCVAGIKRMCVLR